MHSSPAFDLKEVSADSIAEHIQAFVDTKLRVIDDLGVTLKPETVILDFGCGAGYTVSALRSRGYHAVGCDISPGDDGQVGKDPHLLLMSEGKIPLPDSAVDVIISESV